MKNTLVRMLSHQAAALVLGVVCVALPGQAWAFCGDGLLDGLETCDDGNANDGDGCENDCTLSPGCTLYPATGLPLPIPDGAFVQSSVTVTQPGTVSEVEVIGLAGTHTYVSDLRVTLISPNSMFAPLMHDVCGFQDDFFLSFDDDAPGGPFPCPPIDGRHHLPTIGFTSSPTLGVFAGQPAMGTWTLSVSDVFFPDPGFLDAWALKVCTAECGNNVTEGGETCDDGNLVDDDGCDSNCTVTACGNGIQTTGELCDDGNVVLGDGCRGDCTIETCGDGIPDPQEGCDDGNLVDDDGCDSNCTVTACGNGIQTTGELCDDGNVVPGDGCRANCTIETCGDNIEDPQERCDDGNVVGGDGCDADCTLPCPADFCECMSSAASFDVVGTAVEVAPDKLSYGGYSYAIGAATAGAVCALTGKLSGKEEGESEIGTDLVATSGLGTTALKIKGYKYYGDSYPGVLIGGDLVTGGGEIRDASAATVSGATDLTGLHPQVAVCAQALTAAQTASNTFKMLPADRTIEKLVVAGGQDYRLEAGPGVYVVSIVSITVKSVKDYDEFEGGTLTIAMAPETDAVILNVEKGISLATGAAIVVEGAPERVILNVHNGAGKVKIGADTIIDPAILVPGGKISTKRNAEIGNLIGASKAQIKGALVGDVLGCAE